MARGDPPFPLEHLVPYFRGGRFATVAVKGRRYGLPALDRQIERYIAMADHYSAAAVATFRLRRQRERDAASRVDWGDASMIQETLEAYRGLMFRRQHEEGIDHEWPHLPRPYGWTDHLPEVSRNGCRAYLALPGQPSRRGVLVLHEAGGLNDDIRRITDRFAEERYVALAPDMFGGPRCLMRTLRGEARNASFDEWREWLRAEHGVERAAVIGFCLGGGFALAYAATGAPVQAASSNYGFVPKDLAKVCPVVGSYGEDDRRLVPQARRLDAELDRLGIDHDVKIYPGAGHSFMNHHDGAFASFVTRVSPFPLGYHAEAAEDAWRRILAFFEKHLGPA